MESILVPIQNQGGKIFNKIKIFGGGGAGGVSNSDLFDIDLKK
jgi:hypothetical protein